MPPLALQQSVTRLASRPTNVFVRNTMTKLSQIQDPVAHLLISRSAWQSSAAATREFHPTGGHGNVMSVHSPDLYIVGIRVRYVAIPHSRTCSLETKSSASRSSTRVCSAHTPHRCNVCTCTLRCPAQYKRLSFGELLFTHSLIDPTGSCSTILSPPQASQDHVPALGGRVLSLSCHCAAHRRPCLLVRSASFNVHNCKVTHRQLHCHMASVPVQHHRTESRQRTANPNRNAVTWNIGADGVHAASSAAQVIDALQSEACRCFTWSCSLSVRN